MSLKEGKMDVIHYECAGQAELKKRLNEDRPDFVLATYEISSADRNFLLGELKPCCANTLLIFAVDEKNEKEAAKLILSDVWDYVVKDQLHKLVPSIYASRKYFKVVEQRQEFENAMKESRERYRSIFQSAHTGFVLFDAETFEVTDHNPRFLEIFELNDENIDINRLQVEDFLNPDEGYSKERVRELVEEASRGEAVSVEWCTVTESGRKIWTRNSLSLVLISERRSLLLVTENINKQKETERSLQKSQEHFRALAENSPDVIMRFDPQLRHIFVNKAAEDQTGIKVEHFLNKTHEEMGVFPKDKVVIWEEALKEVFSTGKSHTIVFDLEIENGILVFEWRLYPETSTSKSIESVIAVARNITESRVSQDALSQSEERLNLALTASDLGLWDWDLISNEVYFSPIWFSMLGYGPDDLPHELDTWTNLLHPDDQERSVQTVQEVIKNRDASFEIEFRLRTKVGDYTWIRSIGKAVRYDTEGNTTRLTGIHENIDERKRDELVKQVLFDISDAVSTTQSLDELYVKIRESLGRVVDTTNCFLALYNEETDTLALPFMEDEKDDFTEFPARKTLTSYVIRTGVAQLVDVEREKELTELGEIEPVGAPCVSWLGVPLEHEGKTIGVFAVQSYSDDVVFTESDAYLLEFASDQIALAIERRRHQDDIRSSQERQLRIFESMPDSMIVVDPKGRITDFNSAFHEAFQVNKDQVYGEKIFSIFHPDHWKRAISDFKETWEKGYLKNLEYKAMRPDKSFFNAEVSSGAIYTSDGKPESMVFILKNISMRKEAERRLIEAKLKAEESDKLKTAFLSNMSHEIRTPMNAIVGFADLVSDEEISAAERKDFISQINQGADDLMRLIDDIIDVAKIEAGQVSIHISECFVRELYKELHLMYLQHIKSTGKNKVTIRVQWDWSANDLAIYTDPFRLKQILINLLSNAVKFTEEGEIVLGLENHRNGVYFYVKDSGIGIREEKQKVIFERFTQGHETRTKLYGGTGLGLAISKNLTEILGGEIGVKSISGEGATFWFTLPRNEVPLKYEAKLKAPRSSERSWEGKKVLIAEDDHSNYYYLYEALRDTGIEILWSKDGEETLELFREHRDLDLVLMDINMPLLNGYECTEIIKKERPEVRVVAQTAYAMAGEREISQKAGCDDYLSKPIKVYELMESLTKYL